MNQSKTITKKTTKKTMSSKTEQTVRPRDGPQAIGSRKIPPPVKDSLLGMNFLVIGILDCINSDGINNLITESGGRLMKSLGKTCQYVIVGREPSLTKLEKAREMNKIFLSEIEFFAFVERQALLLKKSMSSSSDDTVVMLDKNPKSPMSTNSLMNPKSPKSAKSLKSPKSPKSPTSPKSPKIPKSTKSPKSPKSIKSTKIPMNPKSPKSPKIAKSSKSKVSRL